ncbi:MAG: flagellar biosynthetic protein FliR [Phycisphaerae bacterium]|nr:flagellar biosynthetic protein FliR [Phycisphaerae bacterium]
MPDSLLPILPHLPAFLLVMFRLSGIFLLAPMFGSSLVPLRVKALLALTLSFCIYPMVPLQVPAVLSVESLAVAVGAELLIGLVIGLGATIPLVGAQVGAELMGQQLGLSLARVFNPDTDVETTVMSQMFFLLALAIFLVLDGHHALVSVLVLSFQSVPLGGFAPGGEVVTLLTGLLDAMLALAVKVAAPLLCLVFLETVAVGFIARTVPQINILSLGFPLRIILGLGLMVAMLAVVSEALADSMTHAVSALFAFFSP